MLKQRNLPYSGTKAKMASRLSADDIKRYDEFTVFENDSTHANESHSPFLFLRLPPELRIQVYKLLAPFDASGLHSRHKAYGCLGRA